MLGVPLRAVRRRVGGPLPTVGSSSSPATKPMSKKQVVRRLGWSRDTLDLVHELVGVPGAVGLDRVGHENRGLAWRKCGVVQY